ncbi:uncharacterized protein BJX67DRAFT_368962 [Aspergillus lucknowensis]|uniref:Ion transport domain-containing protein n=1 Tax=Aspergillus lucknowensis TaxID=176173 RepID=A0ABR4L3Q4_9EURO
MVPAMTAPDMFFRRVRKPCPEFVKSDMHGTVPVPYLYKVFVSLGLETLLSLLSTAWPETARIYVPHPPYLMDWGSRMLFTVLVVDFTKLLIVFGLQVRFAGARNTERDVLFPLWQAF